MRKQMTKALGGLAALAALGLGGSAIAGAAQGPDPAVQSPAQGGNEGPESASEQKAGSGQDKGENASDAMATGPDAERAKAAALQSTPGEAVAVERDNENGATWEVEVKKNDGTSADVRLDDAFKVVTVENDTEKADAGP